MLRYLSSSLLKNPAQCMFYSDLLTTDGKRDIRSEMNISVIWIDMACLSSTTLGHVVLQVPGHWWSRSHGRERPLCRAGESAGDAEHGALQPHEANFCVLSHTDHGSQPAHPPPAEKEEESGPEDQAGNSHGESGDQVQTQNRWPHQKGGDCWDPDGDTNPLSEGGQGLLPLLLLAPVSWPHHGLCQQYRLYQETELPAGYLGLHSAASSCQHAPETTP